MDTTRPKSLVFAMAGTDRLRLLVLLFAMIFATAHPAGAQVEDETQERISRATDSLGRALLALLGVIVLGAALLILVGWGAHRVRRTTRRPSEQTESDPLWFLKAPRTRRPPESKDEGEQDKPEPDDS